MTLARSEQTPRLAGARRRLARDELEDQDRPLPALAQARGVDELAGGGADLLATVSEVIGSVMVKNWPGVSSGAAGGCWAIAPTPNGIDAGSPAGRATPSRRRWAARGRIMGVGLPPTGRSRAGRHRWRQGRRAGRPDPIRPPYRVPAARRAPRAQAVSIEWLTGVIISPAEGAVKRPGVVHGPGSAHAPLPGNSGATTSRARRCGASSRRPRPRRPARP